MPEDFSSDTIKSYDYFYIGDRVLFEGRSLQIKTVDAVLTDGILECTYSMGLKTSFQAAPNYEQPCIRKDDDWESDGCYG